MSMGEDPATVHVVGAPGLDNLWRRDLWGLTALESRLGLPLKPPVVIVTLHSATLGDDPRDEVSALVAAMNEIPATYIITAPNTDPGHEHLMEWNIKHPHRFVSELGACAYWGLMQIADAMVGNSSSGMIEAPALQLPVVNIGDRQKGRLRGANVIDVDPVDHEIASAMIWALTPEFRVSLRGTSSPYGDGTSGDRIAKVLSAWRPPNPPRKKPVQC